MFVYTVLHIAQFIRTVLFVYTMLHIAQFIRIVQMHTCDVNVDKNKVII